MKSYFLCGCGVRAIRLNCDFGEVQCWVSDEAVMMHHRYVALQRREEQRCEAILIRVVNGGTSVANRVWRPDKSEPQLARRAIPCWVKEGIQWTKSLRETLRDCGTVQVVRVARRVRKAADAVAVKQHVDEQTLRAMQRVEDSCGRGREECKVEGGGGAA